MNRMNKSGNSCKCEDKTNQKNIQLKEERKNILRKKMDKYENL